MTTEQTVQLPEGKLTMTMTDPVIEDDGTAISSTWTVRYLLDGRLISEQAAADLMARHYPGGPEGWERAKQLAAGMQPGDLAATGAELGVYLDTRPPGDRARDEARDGLRATLTHMARATGAALNPDELGQHAPGMVTDHAAGLPLAALLRDMAGALLNRYIRHAREVGESWARIGELLGLAGQAGEQDIDLGELAFETATGTSNIRFAEAVFRWDCQACGKLIGDFGPNSNHPADDQRGHRESCTALAALIEEYESW